MFLKFGLFQKLWDNKSEWFGIDWKIKTLNCLDNEVKNSCMKRSEFNVRRRRLELHLPTSEQEYLINQLHDISYPILNVFDQYGDLIPKIVRRKLEEVIISSF